MFSIRLMESTWCSDKKKKKKFFDIDFSFPCLSRVKT